MLKRFYQFYLEPMKIEGAGPIGGSPSPVPLGRPAEKAHDFLERSIKCLSSFTGTEKKELTSFDNDMATSSA